MQFISQHRSSLVAASRGVTAFGPGQWGQLTRAPLSSQFLESLARHQLARALAGVAPYADLAMIRRTGAACVSFVRRYLARARVKSSSFAGRIKSCRGNPATNSRILRWHCPADGGHPQPLHPQSCPLRLCYHHPVGRCITRRASRESARIPDRSSVSPDGSCPRLSTGALEEKPACAANQDGARARSQRERARRR